MATACTFLDSLLQDLPAVLARVSPDSQIFEEAVMEWRSITYQGGNFVHFTSDC